MSNLRFVGRLVTAGLLVVGVQAAQAEPELFPEPELSREALVRAVLARNPTLESARHAWQAALAEVPIAEALPDPMARVEVAPASPFAGGGFGASVMLLQGLPWPGKRALRAQMAQAQADAARRGLEGTRLALALTASQLFDDYYLVDRTIAINAEHRALLEDFKRVATSLFSTGQASLQDPLQAEVEIANLLRRDVALAADRKVLVAQLNRLLQRAPGTPLPPPPSTLLATAAPDATPSRRQPEVLAAEAQIKAARIGGALAATESRPDFEAIASYNSMWEHPAHRWMVGVGVNIPIWRDRLQAQAHAAEERLAAAKSDAIRVEDELAFEVDSARTRVAEGARQLEIYSARLLPASADQVAAARSGFETGRNSFLALIEAERNQRAVRLEYEETLAQLSKSRAGLARALGELPANLHDDASRGEP